MTSRKGPGIYRNAMINWATLFYVAAVSFFLAPVVVRSLGSAAYGVWSLLVAVVGYLGLLDFGVRGAVTRYIAHHHAVGDLRSSSLITTAAMMLFGMLGLLAVLIACGVAWGAPLLFNIPPELMTESRAVLAIGGVTVLVTLVGAVYGGVVTGLERFDISGGIEIGLTTVRSTAVYIVLKMGYGLVALAVIQLASAGLYFLGMRITVHRIMPDLRLLFAERLLPWVKTILSFSAWLSIIHVLAVVIFYTDALVIGAVLPISAVGMYAIAGTLVDYAMKVTGGLSKIFTPRVSAMKSAGGHDIAATVLDGARAATLVTLPIAITFVLRGETFINLWMGPEYGSASGSVLQVLALVIWVGSARTVACAAIIGLNMHRKLIPLLAFEAICNLVLSLVLVRTLGLIGVAVGTLLPALLVSLVLVPRCLREVAGAPVSRYLMHALARPTLFMVPFALATWAVEAHLHPAGLLGFVLQVALVIPVAIVGAFLVLGRVERGQLIAALRSRLGSA
ncbi:MAG TPA: oligosaccharide flippase family protein [Steroidobacteraceae bacterium]|nr:oligosaccharide flippase family protein [Steroidobacteraceae bacterium]